MKKKLTSEQLADKIEGMGYKEAIKYCLNELSAKRDPMGCEAIARFYYEGADNFYSFMFFQSLDHQPILTKATRPKFNFNHQCVYFS